MWINDRKHGYCFEILENGSTFSGEYANGKPQGKQFRYILFFLLRLRHFYFRKRRKI